MSKLENLSGKVFTRLTVVSNPIMHKNKSGRSLYSSICKCSCGKTIKVLNNNLKTMTTRSCGCLRKDRDMSSLIKHGMAGVGINRNRFYNIWSGMKERCYREKYDKFYLYGGRGVIVADKWHNFINFKDDMYDSYLDHVDDFGEKQTTLDRINTNGNYTLKNCRWATYKEQNNNRRKFK